MTVTTRQCIWGFIYWMKHNPFKSIEAGMTFADLDEMLVQYAAVNATDTSMSTDPGSYGDMDFPKKGTAPVLYATDTNGVASGANDAANILLCEQSQYPDQHQGG